jgi:prepilin-type N-terminal cleavage/methylation domain-containing protein
MNRKMRSESGFSLVESLVALTILAIGMAGFGTLLHTSMQGDINTDINRRMNSIAQEIIEDLRGRIAQLRFDQIQTINLANGNNSLNQMWQSAGANSVDMRGTASGGYVYRWMAEDNLPSGAGTVRLTVTVGTIVQPPPQFPRDPGDRRFTKYSVVMTNFVTPGK